jgi:hypothetical protein
MDIVGIINPKETYDSDFLERWPRKVRRNMRWRTRAHVQVTQHLPGHLRMLRLPHLYRVCLRAPVHMTLSVGENVAIFDTRKHQKIMYSVLYFPTFYVLKLGQS